MFKPNPITRLLGLGAEEGGGGGGKYPESLTPDPSDAEWLAIAPWPNRVLEPWETSVR